MALTRALKEHARTMGIDCLGIASAEPFTSDEAILQSRVAAHMYPALADSNTSLRCNPQAILPGCRSIIMVAQSYVSDGRCVSPTSLQGHVARYARGIDYHHVLPAKLENLASFLQQHSDQPFLYRVHVDSGPLLERATACRAGIGWIGKNALLYTTRYGSWAVLGALLTTLPLTPDPPAIRSRCGACNQCMQACPTGAIVAPYQVDPSRCLSYITQMPGSIPTEYRKALGRRIWGCDVCQTACPWNRHAVPAADDVFGKPLEPPDLVQLLTMSKSDFKRYYGHTAMHWRGKATLQRNAAIALGNLGAIDAIPTLTQILIHDNKPVLRGACAWALGEIGGSQAIQALVQAKELESNASVIYEIQQALHGL